MRFAIILIIFAFLGCHKKAEVLEQGQNSPDFGTPFTNSLDGKPTQRLPPAPPKVTANADNYVRQNVNGMVDPNLSALLRQFVQKNGRRPQSFTEFANRCLGSTPRPPEGTKWVIDGPNRQVKAVLVK